MRIVIYVQFPEGTDLAAPDGGRFDFVKTPPFNMELLVRHVLADQILLNNPMYWRTKFY